VLEYINIYIYKLPPAFPVASSMWHFLDPVLLTTSLFLLLKCIASVEKNIE